MSSIRTPHLDRFYQAITPHTNWTKHTRYSRGASQHANGIFKGDVQLIEALTSGISNLHNNDSGSVHLPGATKQGIT